MRGLRLTLSPVHVVGAILALGGIPATLDVQIAMGTSWRIGVDADERQVPGAAGALEVQVRVVGEPHLRRAHGSTYNRAGRVGPFVPRLGRL